jgi:excisionase family DNA binding protein
LRGPPATAEAVGVDIQTIDKWIFEKKLRASKLGRRVLVRVAHIEAMLAANVA